MCGIVLARRPPGRSATFARWLSSPPSTSSRSASCVPAAQPPARTRPGDAGYDLRTAESFSLWPGERVTVPTGVAVALPPGVAGLVTPRSGLAASHGISVVNGPGLIDPNYRGEIRVVLVNLGDARFEAAVGDRIAQLCWCPSWPRRPAWWTSCRRRATTAARTGSAPPAAESQSRGPLRGVP